MLQEILSSLLKNEPSKLIYQNQAFNTESFYFRTLELIKRLETMNCDSNSIAIYLPNSPELLCWQLACFLCGIPIVPLVYEYESEFVKKALELTRPKYLLTTEKKSREILKTPLISGCGIIMVNEEFESLITAKPIELNYNKKIPSNKPALVVFSSETSNQFHGIVHTYQSLNAYIKNLSDVFSINSQSIYLFTQSMGNINGIATILAILQNKGSFILLQDFEINEYIEIITLYQPTHMHLNAASLSKITNHSHIDKTAFSKIQYCFAENNFLDDLPTKFTSITGTPIQTEYSKPEIGIITLNSHPYNEYKGSFGEPIKHVKIKLVNEEGKSVKKGDVGEIWANSPSCFYEYLTLSELNEKNFEGKWFKTGDLAYMDDEKFFWPMGRKTQIFKRGGHTVYPQLIEQVLFKNPSIENIAVVGVADEIEGIAPAAFVELKKSNAKVTETELFQYAQTNLQPWQVPKIIKIFDHLPLNLTGQIDRNLLKSL